MGFKFCFGTPDQPESITNSLLDSFGSVSFFVSELHRAIERTWVVQSTLSTLKAGWD